MIRIIRFDNHEITTTTDAQYEEQLALMEEAGIVDYTVEEIELTTEEQITTALGELAELDRRSMRSVRAIRVALLREGEPDPKDVAILKDIEDLSEDIRAIIDILKSPEPDETSLVKLNEHADELRNHLEELKHQII